MKHKQKYLFFLTNILYIGWTLLIIVIVAIIINRNYNYAKSIALHTAKTIVNKDLAYRSWVASHGGVYVPVDKETPPNPYLSHIKNRDFYVNGIHYTLMNPAYTLSQMMKDYTRLYGVKTHITSLKLLNPKNKPDEWEKQALKTMEKTKKQYYQLEKIDNKEYLRLMNPLITKKACLKCHGFQGYKVGDLRGGVSVAIPMKNLYNEAFANSLVVSVAFLVIWLLGIMGIRFFSKKVLEYMEEKEKLYEEYIYGLVNVVEKRDSYTAGHSKRVAHYAILIAKEMGISQKDRHILYRAGMLHDIGKIGIPDSVFLKPRKLTDDEFEIIKQHVVLSYELLKNISIFDEIKEIVRDHHEHYDGSGYPRGLKGDETPILAQILMTADAFDAMTTNRIYKPRKTVAEALDEIKSLASKQFNPEIVKYTIKALKDVYIDSNYTQSLDSFLEKERLSYFYRDQLTHVYNEFYLQSNIKEYKAYDYIIWLSLHNFQQYNKTYGWQKGNIILQDIADILDSHCSQKKLYRFYGDNFLMFCSDKSFDIKELDTKISNLLRNSEIEYHLILKKTEDVELVHYKLDELLKQLQKD